VPDEAVRVEGLTGLRKGLREADRELPKALTEAHREVAAIVVDAARPNLRTKHGRIPAKSRLAASGTQGGAFVKVVGATAFGDEFGSNRYTQFRPHQGQQGYAVYPAIRTKREQIMDRYGDIVETKVLQRAARAGD
jgi:hypothetical protein